LPRVPQVTLVDLARWHSINSIRVLGSLPAAPSNLDKLGRRRSENTTPSLPQIR
jgi:hypothetical protein